MSQQEIFDYLKESLQVNISHSSTYVSVEVNLVNPKTGEYEQIYFSDDWVE